MKPLIIQLQEDLVTGKKKVEELLRLAKLIASKLQLTEIEHWIQCEIAGYGGNENVPVLFAGILEVHNPNRGWIPVSGVSRISVPIGESITELERFLNEDVVQFQPAKLFPVTDMFGGKFLSGMPQRVQLSTTAFRGIIENVRNKLLDWALELKKQGVVGENMSFNKQEKQIAQNITVNNIEKFTGARQGVQGRRTSAAMCCLPADSNSATDC